MKVLFDTRHYVLDKELTFLAKKVSLYILERIDLRDAGGIVGAQSTSIEQGGHGLERWLSSHGLQLTLPTYIKNYRSILSSINPDTLVAADFFRLSSWQAFWYKRSFRNVKLVLLCETKRYPNNPLSALVMHLMLVLLKHNISLIDKVIVYTEEGKNFLSPYLPKVPIIVLPPVIDEQLFYPMVGKEFLPDGTLRILMNARFFKYKRHAVLLKAVKKLVDEGKSILITFIGREGENKESVVREVESLGLSQIINFVPPVEVSEISNINNQHDILVLPSYNEALGMVVPEAMSCGLPTITSDSVGSNIYVKKDVTGFVFKTDNIEDLYQHLKKCFDSELLKSMGRSARSEIENNHSLSKYQDRLYSHVI